VPRHRPDEEAVRGQLREEQEAVDGSTSAEEDKASVADAMDAAASEAEASRAAGGAPVGEDEATSGEEGGGQLDPLAKAEAERDRYLELAQRAQADFENYRKRAAKEAANAGERAKIGLLRDFLPVLDNLERALESADQEAALAEGVRLVHSELVNVLKRNGVEPIEAEGRQFDPTVHEAMSTMAQDGTEPGTVLHVVEKGYRLNDTVIRPARVVVSA
jgi:molecular chaperone GrpE